MNMSKYTSLPNSEFLTSKMVTGPSEIPNYTDVIEALNLEIYNFLKICIKISQLIKFLFSILKITKVTRLAMFLIMMSL